MIYILLPAFNEENNLPGLLDEINARDWAWKYNVVIVNDGSTDKTQEIACSFALRMPLTLLNHKVNLGLGKALRTGLNYLSDILSDNDAVVTMDADQTHPVELINALKEKLDSGFDIVVASRFCPGGEQINIPMHRRFLSFCANFLINILWPIENIRDYTSGFRIFSAAVIKKLSKIYGEDIIKEKGFTSTVELFFKASLFTANISQVPLKLDYGRKKSKSKLKLVSTVLGYAGLLFKTKSFIKK
jgi:dolichol-phosphate mannosyltransferase